MEKVIKLDVFLQTVPPLLRHLQSTRQCNGDYISVCGAVPDAAEAWSRSKFSAVLKKMCAHLRPQTRIYGAVAQARPWLIHYAATCLRFRAFVLAMVHFNTHKSKQSMAPVKHF